jgi:DNA-binding NarL/FixJ family response regulator
VAAVLVDAAAAGPRTAERLVRGGIELVGRTAAAAEAVRLVTGHSPQVVVADLDGGAPVLTAIGSLAAAAPQVPVLALLAAVDHAAVLTAVRAGATSLLVAPGSAAELAAAVRRTAGGEAVFSPGLADVVLAEAGRPLDPQEGARRLTERESDVLRLVVEGLTARQIAGRLVLSPRTVENHVQNVLRKLRLHSRAALVRYAIENGLA